MFKIRLTHYQLHQYSQQIHNYSHLRSVTSNYQSKNTSHPSVKITKILPIKTGIIPISLTSNYQANNSSHLQFHYQFPNKTIIIHISHQQPPISPNGKQFTSLSTNYINRRPLKLNAASKYRLHQPGSCQTKYSSHLSPFPRCPCSALANRATNRNTEARMITIKRGEIKQSKRKIR